MMDLCLQVCVDTGMHTNEEIGFMLPSSISELNKNDMLVL